MRGFSVGYKIAWQHANRELLMVANTLYIARTIYEGMVQQACIQLVLNTGCSLTFVLKSVYIGSSSGIHNYSV